MIASSSRRRGSVLLTCLLFSIVIAISLTSYLTLANNSYKMADRAFLNATALALAGQGLEEGMECFNQVDNASSPQAAWSGWTLSGSVATLKRTNIALDNGAIGTIQVYASNYNPPIGAAPKLVAKATVLPASGLGLSRIVELTLRRRTLYAAGLEASNGITISGTPNVSSWNSNPSGDLTVAPVDYSEAVNTSSAFVGTTSATSGALSTGGAAIYGRLGTGGGPVTHTGTVLTSSPTGTGWDTTLIDPQFAQHADTSSAPALPAQVNNITTSITATTTLPRSGDVVASDGNYYYNFANGVNVALTGASNLIISGKVAIYLQSHAGVGALALSGTAQIQIASTGGLVLYTNGNIACGGNGISNATSRASRCLIYGTNTGSGQTISLNVPVTTFVAFDASNADITITGTAELRGSVVSRNLSLSGLSAFRYDEALLMYSNTLGGSGNSEAGAPWGVGKWREMALDSERASYSATFNF